MTVLNTVLLVIGMGVIGVPLILGLLSPIAGAIVARTVSEPNWDAAMLFFAQIGGAAATYLIGVLVLGLPWYAALIAALLVGVTSYVRRVPEPTF